jgi:hypothetical protein
VSAGAAPEVSTSDDSGGFVLGRVLSDRTDELAQLEDKAELVDAGPAGSELLTQLATPEWCSTLDVRPWGPDTPLGVVAQPMASLSPDSPQWNVLRPGARPGGAGPADPRVSGHGPAAAAAGRRGRRAVGRPGVVARGTKAIGEPSAIRVLCRAAALAQPGRRHGIGDQAAGPGPP